MPTEPDRAELDLVDDAMARGELFLAYDTAMAGLDLHPSSLGLKHRAILALARSGATERALRLYREWQLHEVHPNNRELAVDIAALGARLLKDRALAAPAEEQSRSLGLAADAYLTAFRCYGGHYPGANAAALFLWAGQVDRAKSIAEQVLNQPSDRDHFALASRAECMLIVGNQGEAAKLISSAAGAGGNQMTRAAMRRQLARTCSFIGCDSSMLAPLRARSIVRFLGHMAGKRLPLQHEPALASAIAKLLADDDAGTGYGALAAGADILFAEALLNRGAELNVILPFSPEAFERVSVEPFDDGRWVPRFARCLGAAASVTVATTTNLPGDTLAFRFGSELASGAALLRGQALDAPVIQAAVWDGEPTGIAGGTAEDVLFWSRLGLPQRLLSPDGSFQATVPDRLAIQSQEVASGREIRAVVFGDVCGFGRLTEEQIPVFSEQVLGALARATMPFADHILVRNTWGDGLFLVIDDIVASAECLLKLHEAFSALDLARLALPLTLGLRLGAHYGPMTRTTDPITGRKTYLGIQVIQAARIEPITPPGTSYVTEPFAAALALRPNSGFSCDYFGRVVLAKDGGEVRIFSLRRAPTVENAAPSGFTPSVTGQVA